MTEFSPDLEVGLKVDTSFSSSTKDVVASTDEMKKRELERFSYWEPVRFKEWVAMMLAFSVLSMIWGWMWCYKSFARHDDPDKEMPKHTAIACGIAFALMLCSLLCLGCGTVYMTVSLLIRQQLPEVVATRIKALEDMMNSITFSAAFSCCFMILSAIFMWRLYEVAKILVVKYDDLVYWLISAPFFSVGCTTFLSLAVMCAGRCMISIFRKVPFEDPA